MSSKVETRALRLTAATFLGVIASGLLLGACAAGPADEPAAGGDAEGEVGEAAQSVCQASYDPLIAQARSLIAQNCGQISACGGNDSYTHADVFLANSHYCDCYDYMWQNRDVSPWSQLQVIYHEPGDCTTPHIHLEKKAANTCGIIHFNIDEGNDTLNRNCWDDETGADIDYAFCGAATRKGTCDDPTTGSSCSNAALPLPNDRWRLKIWANQDMTGDPVETRYAAVGERGFSFNWGSGGPSACAGTDNFSIVFTRSAYFPVSGNYTFTTTVDDGVRLFIDGVRIINAWTDQVASHQTATYVAQGWHTVRMNHYENAGMAVAVLTWGLDSDPYPDCACPVAPSNNLCHNAASTPGCPMTYPGGYCDPNGDASFFDGNWDKGWYDYQAYCL